MSGKGLHEFTQQMQEKTQEGVNAVEKATKDAVEQVKHKGQQAMSEVCKQAEDGAAKATEHMTTAANDMQKKIGLFK